MHCRIEHVRAIPVNIPYRDVPVMACGPIASSTRTIIEIRASNGMTGLGETTYALPATIIDGEFAPAILGLSLARPGACARAVCGRRAALPWGVPGRGRGAGLHAGSAALVIPCMPDLPNNANGRYSSPCSGQDEWPGGGPGDSMTVANSRLTREDWIAFARKALVTSGIDDVKVDVLARRMKVTRGSFYWHFESRQDMLNALLDDWEANNRREIDTIRSLVATEGDALVELFRIWLGEDPSFPAFDIAIRVWARKAPVVSKLVRKIDEAWISLLQEQLERDGMTAPESFVRARIMYFHQVGYFALSINEDIAERVKLAPYYYAALTGSPAPEGLIDSLLSLKPAKGRSETRVKAAKKRSGRASTVSSGR